MLTPQEKKNILHYFTSDISVFISVYIMFMSMIWISYDHSKSSAELGILGFVQNVPFMLFSICGGVLADRFNRKKIIIGFNCLFILNSSLILIFQIFNILSFNFILLFCFCLGSFYALYYPSLVATVKDMVSDPKEFPKIMGAASSNAKIGQLIASSTFSFLLKTIGAVGTFMTGVFFNIVSLVSFLFLKGLKQNEPVQTDGVFAQISQGLKYTLSNKILTGIILVTALISCTFVFVSFQLPAIDTSFLKGGSTDLGIMFIAGAVGGLTAGIYLGKRKSTKNLLKFLIICVFLSAFAMFGLSYSRFLGISFIFGMFVDFSFIAAMGISNTLLQLFSDKDKVGRVLGVNIMFSWGLSSVLMMVFGFLITPLGLETVMIILGSITALLGVLYYTILKKQKNLLQNIYTEKNIPEGSYPY
ncbi:MAG TPA: hypothetical protein DEP28_00905 [Bacteroidetes bacterium]|nr:hypothetical protein [Bacteroidota bacterium]HCN37578.1 hypothetical protein [Bacteroidota bacterium]